MAGVIEGKHKEEKTVFWGCFCIRCKQDYEELERKYFFAVHVSICLRGLFEF